MVEVFYFLKFLGVYAHVTLMNKIAPVLPGLLDMFPRTAVNVAHLQKMGSCCNMKRLDTLEFRFVPGV